MKHYTGENHQRNEEAMSKLPCKVSADERNHDLKQWGSEARIEQEEKAAHEQANEMICDPMQLAELIMDRDVDIYPQLSRMMRELDKACMGAQISRDAILNAAALIQKLLLASAMDLVKKR